ncbi:hypothetical protein CMV_027507 [Castanea mollissima]|uniref:Ion transport domain-containing protein n=1 Tax=Castanea mollissima TaxID=60419 RepID=A0A8J4VD47_9ROSI|nr:hypothetical protein CMV_027507 [Castanea mollissima]
MPVRFYSLQWKTWAASHIQAAWHRYHERKAWQLVASKQLGTGTMRESLISLCMKQKTGCKMVWQTKQGPQRLDTMVKAKHQKGCYYCHRSLMNPISLVKINRSMVFQVIIMFISLRWTFIWMKEMDSKRLKCLRFKRFKKRKSILPVSDQQKSAPRKDVLDPRSQFLRTWNKIFMLSCVISMALDPLFFYIPVIHDKDKCLDSDLTLAKIACALRSLFDAFYVLHIIFRFHTAFIAPSSQVFGRGEMITDPVAIAKRYLSTYFLIDMLSILPLPQVLVFITIPSIKTQAPLFMKLVIFSQYVPRITRICILYREETRTSGMLIQPWTGAAYNLFLYMLASFVLGAFWYLCAIEREETCWQKHCKNSTGCEDKDFYCGDYRNESFAHLYYECPFIKPDDIENTTVFNFGMFTDVLKSGMVETKDFQVKLFYCFWWGFRSLG